MLSREEVGMRRVAFDDTLPVYEHIIVVLPLQYTLVDILPSGT